MNGILCVWEGVGCLFVINQMKKGMRCLFKIFISFYRSG